MPHMGGSKSIATLMAEKTENGIEPTEIFVLSHTKCKDGRSLDDDSSRAIDMINDQPHHSVSYEGDVYSQVFGNEKSTYVRGLGLGLTPSVL
ncbi:hypothetical protein P3L10_015790 [Capsicum annuum]